MMSRCAAFVLLLALGIEIQLSHATEVSVNTTDNKLCLYANLMVNFSVTYEAAGNKSETAEFELPDSVTTEGSTCGNTSSTLKLHFGDGHSWIVEFSKKDKTYQADSVIFSYNLSDSTIFPNAASNETKNVTVKPHITDVGMDTSYSCKSKEMLQTDAVNQTLWNVLIQAFVSNGSKSENITVCAADVPATTVAPTTNTTVVTTAVPVTNSTAPLPTTTPTPPLPLPNIGNYSISDNGTVCLLANFGLRVTFTHGEKSQEMNLNASVTAATGSCGVNSSELVLSSDILTVILSFTNESKKFKLHALNVTAKSSSGAVLTEANSSLGLWEAAVGSSYMCNKQQDYNITDVLTIHTFDLRVQPFGVHNGQYSTAEECQADVESYLVPIAVGVALVVLILIVLLAYFIGRKRNRATGYESF
ncbi:lysosome-associated membrane glycoprotein 2 isoform X2 [Myripristis murdjan]|uniref:lysosome-associated membrane glycoprotein 2 isoform X2 n=1 Tax=Myripristis murdjan TaxID=586833 RepID=UPI0011764150|nr:lysosome-associated membrane glycoprotein 2 isoform X2 [Myripristis murdjan]